MSAITPLIEYGEHRVKTENEVETERALEGLGEFSLGGLGGLADLPELRASHASLTRTLWIRRLLERALATRTYRVIQSWELTPKGRPAASYGEMAFKLDRPMSGGEILWMTAAFESYGVFTMWGETAKMQCPSFDLPAGGMEAGGACPGADAGQSIVSIEKRMAQLSLPDGRAFTGCGTACIPNVPPGQSERVELRERDTICSLCVTGDTLVLVRGEGLVSIAQLADRGRIVVWSGKAWRETEAVFNGVKPTVLLTMSDGRTLRCTADHNIIVTDNIRIPAGDLEVNEALPWELPEEVAYPLAAELPLIALGDPGRNEKRGEMPTSWSRELGVWLGYIVGDGSLNDNSKYPMVSLCASEQDRDDLDRLVTSVAAWTGSEAEVRIGEPQVGTGLVERAHGRMAHVAWRQKSAVALLHALGLKKQGEHTHTPMAIWTASRDAVAGYLSGLFSTDGSVGFRGAGIEVSFANTSKRLVDEVRQMLFAFGIKTSFCEYTSNRERGYLPLWKASITCRESVLRFKDRIGFFNVRKAARLEDFLASSRCSKSERKSNAHVESVVPTGKEEPVFDLVDVGPEHQFTANGISVSNCYATAGNYPSPHVQAGEIIRYWWCKSMLEQGRSQEWVDTIVRSMQLLRYPYYRSGIMPVRIHSSGDFFSPKYAEAWVEVANRIWALDKRIIMWAPTRSWAARGWGGAAGSTAEKWRRIFGQLVSARERPGLPNLVLRASGYHVGDRAPDELAPGTARGTTSLLAPGAGVGENDPRARRGSDDDRRDFDCGVYAVGAGAHDCNAAIGIDGAVGCRVCWTHPKVRVNFTTH